MSSPDYSQAAHGGSRDFTSRAALALAGTPVSWPVSWPAYSGLLVLMRSALRHLIVCGVAFLAILGSANYLKREDLDAGRILAR